MSASQRVAVLLCGDELSTGERNLVQILEFFGIKWVRASASSPDVTGAGAEYCLFSSARTLATGTGSAIGNPIIARAQSTFVFEYIDSPECERLLPGMRARQERAGGDVSVSHERPEFCGPMSGIHFTSARSNEEMVFQMPPGHASSEALVAYSGAPVFLRAAPTMYITTGSIEVDLGAPVSDKYFDIKRHWPGTLALIMYLQWAFKGQRWAVREQSASLIIDDPLLKSRYGFLVFRDVLDLMQRHNFATTIAFIPWNWRRTSARTAELFVRHAERYSLVFHGNDHTRGEFGLRSAEALDRKIRMALKRMDAHERRTGIETARVMVFPQGVFSAESLEALKYNNFIAAVNTEVGPAGSDEGRTEIGELWNTAITKFSSFALFTRRYMEHGIENFAFDLLLGKPCLLVGHHEVFKNRGEQLVQFVGRLNSLHCSLKWRGLADVVRRSFRAREGADGATHVQMFANEMLLERSTAVRVTKQECDPTAVRSVTADGQAVPWERDSAAIRFSIEGHAGDRVRIIVQYADRPGMEPMSESLGYRIKCGLRRYMSEVRDDYVCRSALLQQCTSTLLRNFR